MNVWRSDNTVAFRGRRQQAIRLFVREARPAVFRVVVRSFVVVIGFLHVGFLSGRTEGTDLARNHHNGSGQQKTKKRWKELESQYVNQKGSKS